MPRHKLVTLTIERLPKKDADKIVRAIIAEFGVVSIFVQPYQEPQEETNGSND